MSVQKTPNGRWKARYRAPDGRTRSKTWDRKTDAERWLRAELGRRDRGEWVDPKLGKTRFGEWAVTVMGTRLHTRASTRARDRSYLNSLVLPTFGGFELRRITPADIQGWVSKLDGAGYAAETVHKAHALLGMILTAAVDSDLLTRSPARGVKLPRIERREMRFLTPEELSELLEAVPDRYRLLVKTAAYTGLRFGELAGLRPRRCRAAAEEDHGTPWPGRGLRAPARRGTEDPGKSEDRHDPGLARRGTRLPSRWHRRPVRFHGPSRRTATPVGFPVPCLGARNGPGGAKRRPFP